MQEEIENILRAEEKAIVALQDATYGSINPRENSRLQHAQASYDHLFYTYFPQNASAQIAYENTTQRIADIEDQQRRLEENIRIERFELKSPTREISATPFSPCIFLKATHETSQPVLRPLKNKAFSQNDFSSPKRQKPRSIELNSDVLEGLKTTFNKCLEEKRRLQLRANALLARLGIFKKKLPPITVSGVKQVLLSSRSL